MFKKAGVIFVLAMFSLIFAACSPQNQAGSNKTDDWAQYIGQTRAEVFQKLNLEEGKDISPFNDRNGVYLIAEEQKFNNEDFQLVLNFDANTDVMYGYTYWKEFKDDLKLGYDLTLKLEETLIKELGNPTTYPELPHRISNIPDYDQLVADQNYVETWKNDKELTVTLQLIHMPDEGARVTLQYAALESRNK